MSHSNCDHQCHIPSASSLHQTLDELDFERGIWYAAQYGDLSRVKKLIDDGICVDVNDSAGYTALHYAARNGHVDVCKLLLRNGANVDAVTKSGNATSLHRACSAGKLDIVQLLLENNASSSLKDCDGKTALHRAAQEDNFQICRALISQFPALKYEKDDKDKSPFDYAHSQELISLLT